MKQSSPQRTIKRRTIALYDVSYRVKSWGRRGMLVGCILGFAAGLIFLATSFAPGILASRIIGTLIITTIEGAVIAGALSACAAALYGKGVLRGRAARIDCTHSTAYRTPQADWQKRDIPRI
ncbi:hypothetical protein [Rhizomicrobium electricum]|uniref:Uncharacterized protein n=1 Tax=Rhizomicrobium electricum TaxID=480070 RepID=A0ABP3P6P0_9PROT|nr:hypothetical protein [Rhizomicrobium electricum]NIJ47937.1 hypothetical protein [Rhizomicrobium electricum]